MATDDMGPLTLLALPSQLFASSSNIHSVLQGSVVRVYCIATSALPPAVMWLKDGVELRNDPPHIRIRTSTDGNTTSSVLTVDNFGDFDGGNYRCRAEYETYLLNSTILSLSGEYFFFTSIIGVVTI